jgi:hypothetical protein
MFSSSLSLASHVITPFCRTSSSQSPHQIFQEGRLLSQHRRSHHTRSLGESCVGISGNCGLAKARQLQWWDLWTLLLDALPSCQQGMVSVV